MAIIDTKAFMLPAYPLRLNNYIANIFANKLFSTKRHITVLAGTNKGKAPKQDDTGTTQMYQTAQADCIF
jgi:hypothetical protein